jgi:hypothetical protein
VCANGLCAYSALVYFVYYYYYFLWSPLESVSLSTDSRRACVSSILFDFVTCHMMKFGRSRKRKHKTKGPILKRWWWTLNNCVRVSERASLWIYFEPAPFDSLYLSSDHKRYNNNILNLVDIAHAACRRVLCIHPSFICKCVFRLFDCFIPANFFCEISVFSVYLHLCAANMFFFFTSSVLGKTIHCT